jgi:hypothetical protein
MKLNLTIEIFRRPAAHFSHRIRYHNETPQPSIVVPVLIGAIERWFSGYSADDTQQ